MVDKVYTIDVHVKFKDGSSMTKSFATFAAFVEACNWDFRIHLIEFMKIKTI